MTNRIFFYGLYMDVTLLEELGFHPTAADPAKLVDYQLRIGDRATLIPASGHTSFGYLVDLPEAEASELYSRPEVVDYQPEVVEAVLLSDGSQQRALCYLLPKDKLGDAANTEYAAKLARLLESFGLPSENVYAIAERRNDT